MYQIIRKTRNVNTITAFTLAEMGLLFKAYDLFVQSKFHKLWQHSHE